MDKPSISIILPTFNRANAINNAIDSILNQTFTSLEIIIVDDASIDKTSQVVELYQKKDSRITYVKNKLNKVYNLFWSNLAIIVHFYILY